MKRNTYLILGGLIALLCLVVTFHNSSILMHLGTVELVLIALVVNTFVIVYSRRSWRANPYGRALMYSKISLAVLVDLSLTTTFLGPDWEWRSSLRFLIFGGILFAQGRLLQLLFSLRNHEARERYNQGHDNAGREI